jgi:uncharacterized membrane protein YqaE (UPF0057 family)
MAGVSRAEAFFRSGRLLDEAMQIKTIQIAARQIPNTGHRALNQRSSTTALRRNTLKGSPIMRLLIALLLPWLTFFTIGRPFAGIICLILQLTLIGWIPATIWAVYALSQYKTDQKIRDAMGGR